MRSQRKSARQLYLHSCPRGGTLRAHKTWRWQVAKTRFDRSERQKDRKRPLKRIVGSLRSLERVSYRVVSLEDGLDLAASQRRPLWPSDGQHNWTRERSWYIYTDTRIHPHNTTNGSRWVLGTRRRYGGLRVRKSLSILWNMTPWQSRDLIFDSFFLSFLRFFSSCVFTKYQSVVHRSLCTEIWYAPLFLVLSLRVKLDPLHGPRSFGGANGRWQR